MAIRSIGAKALQQNKSDWAEEAKLNTVATKSLGPASVGTTAIKKSTPASPAIRKMRRLVVAGCLGLIVVGSTGCTMTAGLGRSLTQSDCIDDFMIGYRNKALAEKAWHCRKDQFRSQCNGREFKDGFIKGYMEVAEGGHACTPAIAPSEYWGWRYQSSNGQGAVNAWFQGFPQGARAAEEDGVGHWRQVQVSSAPPAAMQPAQPMMYSNSPTPQPAGANPFYQELDDSSAPTESDEIDIDSIDSDAIETDVIDALDRLDSVYSSPSDTFPFAEVDSDSSSYIGQPQERTAMVDRSTVISDTEDINIDEVFGPSSDTINISDDTALPFSFD
ncbi:hypothetical protein [Rubripirellula reticaptiva]|uniref:Uncharacterized protein n=1 Tax=Rubripirellula reticaptiva TaxID=2528013 RepID=A0A5C6F5U2_9BACT|nr:hypothetical protein [Rubripirellula reticaptiva]TWU55446.1 hypothetical protein Poly59_17450 [Rubripirellula reticaptiva]